MATGTFSATGAGTTVSGSKFHVRLAYAQGGHTRIHLQSQMASTAWLTVKTYDGSANDVYDPGETVSVRLLCDNYGQSVEWSLAAV